MYLMYIYIIWQLNTGTSTRSVDSTDTLKHVDYVKKLTILEMQVCIQHTGIYVQGYIIYRVICRTVISSSVLKLYYWVSRQDLHVRFFVYWVLILDPILLSNSKISPQVKLRSFQVTKLKEDNEKLKIELDFEKQEKKYSSLREDEEEKNARDRIFNQRLLHENF